MKNEDYQAIVRTVQNYRGLSRDCSKLLISTYRNYPPCTLKSILSQEIQNRMRIMHRKLFGKDYYHEYLEAIKRGEPIGILLRTATQLNICPALFARKVLEQYYNKNKEIEVTKVNISKAMKDTTVIQDAKLAYEVYLCIIYDEEYGTISNASSESIGEEYEVKLELYLKEREIPFHNENYLRSKGYDKTPDCKLEVPIAVNGFVINWIESKAQFGSPDFHDKYIKEQFLSYWNRFGPGLVIYWFGFVDTIVQSRETRFIIMDHFPENITYMDPNSIRQSLL